MMNIKKIATYFLFLICLYPTEIIYAASEENNLEIQMSILQVKEAYPQFPWRLIFDSFQNINNFKCNKDKLKISLLKGGFSADSLFKIYCSSKTYVLRFMGNSHSQEKRKIITESSKWAGVNGFAPKIQLIDRAGYTFIVSDFAQGTTLELTDTKDTKILQELGRILSKVHNAKPPKINHQEFSQFTYGKEWYKSTINTQKIVGPSVLKKAYERWSNLNTIINNRSLKKVMLHNDLNLRNILKHNNKITLLDWELSGLGDPRKEVAHVIAWYGMNCKLTNIFLKAYYGRKPTKVELNTLKKLKIQILLEFAWVGLSTLKGSFDQKTWDTMYEHATPKTVEDLSIIQMNSESKPSDETTRNLFLGLIKKFMIETSELND